MKYLLLAVVACAVPVEPHAPTLGELFARASASCDRGVATACTQAAVMRSRGRGVAFDRAAVVAAFARACELRDGAGCAAFGAVRWPMREGEITPEPIVGDDARGCAAGFAPSCLALDPPQVDRAIALATPGCAHDDAEACVALADARVLHQSRPQAWTLPSPDALALYAKARGRYERACGAGELGACDSAWRVAELIASLHRRACLAAAGDGTCDAEDATAVEAERTARHANALDCASGDAFACTQPR